SAFSAVLIHHVSRIWMAHSVDHQSRLLCSYSRDLVDSWLNHSERNRDVPNELRFDADKTVVAATKL
ncbi:MAG: hypothetical protein ACT4QC_20220, partial [Planctomycetaceae bacterium]